MQFWPEKSDGNIYNETLLAWASKVIVNLYIHDYKWKVVTWKASWQIHDCS